ncbi:strigolactone esterase D14 [Magnolia sinica]|uniref:strigolactone esterase D14 n=1 Tax=Magnolia sinica TaxID=86752 RepID=UPI002657FA1E|nr:strigolactone esterase D14 [Magnolia sinica]
MVMLENGISAAMNAKIVGSGEKMIILAHGFGGDQSIWEKILPNLAQRYQVLVFDWNFSGAASNPNSFDAVKYSSFDAFSNDLISLVDEMNLKSFVFVGHSMSGMIGCIASIKRPELFQRLVLLGASPRYLNSEDYEGGFDISVVENILSNIECNFQSWAMSFATLGVGPSDPPSIEKFGKSLQSMKPDVALSVAKTIFLSDHRDVLEKIIVPCTIIQTTNDFAVPMCVCHYMHKKLKGSLEIIEGEGHFPQLTHHQLLIDILDRIMGFDCSNKDN